MRTNIVIDDDILEKAFKYSKAKTKKEIVAEALNELIASRQRMDLRELKGKIEFRQDYNHKALRKGK